MHCLLFPTVIFCAELSPPGSADREPSAKPGRARLIYLGTLGFLFCQNLSPEMPPVPAFGKLMMLTLQMFPKYWATFHIPAYIEVLTNQKGRGKSPMSLHGINQRDFEDIIDSRIESRRQEWYIWTLRTLCAKCQNFRFILLWGSRASFKESWRKFLIPDWSIDDFGCQELLMNIKEVPCKISVSFESPEYPPRSLGGYSRFQNGV